MGRAVATESKGLTASAARHEVWLLLRRAVLGALGFLVLILVWEGAVAGGLLDPLTASRPSLVVRDLWVGWTEDDFPAHMLVTLEEFLIGYSLSVIVGIPMAMLMATSRRIEYSLELFLWFLYNAPLVAFYPLLIIWFGLGQPTVIAICFLLSVIPIAINALAGFETVDPHLVRCARSFCTPRLAIFGKVVFPAAMPMIMTGLRVAVGRALVGVTVGELFGANAGLGFLIAKASVMLQTTRAMSALVMVIVLGVASTAFLAAIERQFEHWRET
jgi:ABC-type nitrate/sulfonate/bicarbonate transport system permease component